MSLAGRTVVVTRARAQAAAFIEALEREGARVIAAPVIELVPIEAELPPLASYDLVLVTSQNAAGRLFELGASLAGARFACVGAKTRAFLARRVEGEILCPEAFRGEALAEAILARFGTVEGRRFLVPEGRHARGEAAAILRAHGASVDEILIYDTRPVAPEADLAGADAVSFLSGKTLEYFLEVVPDARAILARAVVAVIGPVAAESAAALGVRVDLVPAEATTDGLVRALVRHFAAP